jgi:hypothetical protein
MSDETESKLAEIKEFLEFPPVTMAQSFAIAARMVLGLIPQFYKDGDDDKQKTAMSYMCLLVFFHELCTPAKHKDKMIALLTAIIDELRKGDNDAGQNQTEV